jgi:hypothetical protein
MGSVRSVGSVGSVGGVGGVGGKNYRYSPNSQLLTPNCLEKVLYLGKPQDRTFRSQLSPKA